MNINTGKENKKTYKTGKFTALRIILGILLFIGVLAVFSSVWYYKVYGNIGFEAILFTLTSSLEGVQGGLVLDWVLDALIPSVIAFAVILFVLLLLPFNKKSNKKIKIVSIVLSFVMFIGFMLFSFNKVGFLKWFVNRCSSTQIYEEKYVSPDSVEIKFPEEKRNLVYIYLESMETSFFSKEDGGGEKENVIPELYNLAKENLNFSQNLSVGGGRHIYGATWTVGGMVAQTAGIPFKSSVVMRKDASGKLTRMMVPNAKSLNTVLRDNGYYQSVMFGSDAEYGARKELFEQHGIDKVLDYKTAVSDGIIPEGYREWWGFEDTRLFNYAKKELTELSKKGKPFSFTMLTADTHHIDGYKCPKCDNEFEAQYSNSLHCSSRQVCEFVKWIQAQDFYKNTTIVISGDHLSMAHEYITKYVDDDYQRRIYNCIINPAIDTEHNKNREFVSFDMFPTTLAAMGCSIEGDRLGFGTNLFSGRKTLVEEKGYSYLNDELMKKSDVYNKLRK